MALCTLFKGKLGFALECILDRKLHPFFYSPQPVLAMSLPTSLGAFTVQATGCVPKNVMCENGPW